MVLGAAADKRSLLLKDLEVFSGMRVVACGEMAATAGMALASCAASVDLTWRAPGPGG